MNIFSFIRQWLFPVPKETPVPLVDVIPTQVSKADVAAEIIAGRITTTDAVKKHGFTRAALDL